MWQRLVLNRLLLLLWLLLCPLGTPDQASIPMPAFVVQDKLCAKL